MASYHHVFRAMGSDFTIRIDCQPTSSQTTREQIQALFQELVQETEEIEQCLSRFRADSELTCLNRCLNRGVRVSERLFDVLELAQRMVEWTGGAFDPRILSSMEAIGYAGAPIEGLGSHQPPDAGTHVVQVHQRDADGAIVQLSVPIDLGGIGKGYTADWLAQRIEQRLSVMDIAGYIVDAGGDIVLWGHQDTGDPWSVGVEDPRNVSQLAAVLQMPAERERAAVCTSSVWRKSWTIHGKTVHHLVDPATGESAQRSLLSVTAISERAAYAEIMTKYVFLRGLMDAALWREVRPVCLWIQEDGALACTNFIQPYISWLAAPDAAQSVTPSV